MDPWHTEWIEYFSDQSKLFDVHFGNPASIIINY